MTRPILGRAKGKTIMGRRRVVAPEEAPARGALYHVIRFDHAGDTGHQVGSNISRDRAEEYVAEHRAADPTKGYEIVKAH